MQLASDAPDAAEIEWDHVDGVERSGTWADVYTLRPGDLGGQPARGLPIGDKGITKLMRRVIIISSLSASFHVLTYIANVIQDSFEPEAAGVWAATSALLMELTIPACGYCGTVHQVKQLVCCFGGCNCLVVTLLIVSFFRTLVRVHHLGGACDQELNMAQRKQCEAWSGGLWEMCVLLLRFLLHIAISCPAFYYAGLLYLRMSSGGDRVSSPLLPVVGEVVALRYQDEEGGMTTTSPTSVVSAFGLHRRPETAAEASSPPPQVIMAVRQVHDQ